MIQKNISIDTLNKVLSKLTDGNSSCSEEVNDWLKIIIREVLHYKKEASILKQLNNL